MSTLPAACFDTCDAANLVAQAIGKTPDICDPKIGFVGALNSCKECLEDNTDDQKNASDALPPALKQYVDYCDSESQVSTDVLPSGESSEVPSPSAPAATDDDSEPTFFSSASLETSSGEPQTSSSAAYVPFVYTDYASGIATMRIPESFLSGQGWVKPDKTTTTPDPGTPEPTPESTPSSSTPNPESSSDQAWIAGPVVGGVAGLALVLCIGFWLYRRRQRQRKPSTGTDDVPELDPKPTLQQLESTETPKLKYELVGSEGIRSAEMPANEPTGHEMEGERIFEKGASDLPRIRRKPLNSGFAVNDG